MSREEGLGAPRPTEGGQRTVFVLHVGNRNKTNITKGKKAKRLREMKL